MTATPTAPDAIYDAFPTSSSRPERTTSPPTKLLAASTLASSAGIQHGSSHSSGEAQGGAAAAAEPADDHGIRETPIYPVVGGALRPPAPALTPATPKPAAPVLMDALLILAAQALDDLEATRIANQNRLRSLRDVYGLAGSPQEAEAEDLVDGIKALEHRAELSLKRALRQHPLGPWVARTVGVGEKQGARLLAAIGDPYIRPELRGPDGTVEPSRPRLVSELWAYCGYHVLPAGQSSPGTHGASASGDQPRAGGDSRHVSADAQDWTVGVAPVRARGQKANWSAEAKSRTWLIASQCLIQDGKPDKHGKPRSLSPYRVVYDDGRAKYADAEHQVECRRCGPTGHPAPFGSHLSAGHQHARALRLVSKAILRDLWAEARALHQEQS